eukprot:scaffold25968_cov24-Tisochrysis_lutea.AAC.1
MFFGIEPSRAKNEKKTTRKKHQQWSAQALTTDNLSTTPTTTGHMLEVFTLNNCTTTNKNQPTSAHLSAS